MIITEAMFKWIEVFTLKAATAKNVWDTFW